MQVQTGTGAVGTRPAQALPCARRCGPTCTALGKRPVPATKRAPGDLSVSYGGSNSTRREHRSRWAGSMGSSSPEVAVQQTVVELDLPGNEFLSTVQLELMPMGKGQAVVVVAVAEGSRAEQRGLTVGQRLKAVSDPLRAGTMWQLQDRPSLRFVKDTVKMKRNQPIDLEFIDFVSPETVEATFFGTASLATSGGSVDGSIESDGGASSGPDEPEVAAALQSSNTAAALDALLTGIQEEAAAAAQRSSSSSGTIADRLAQKYDESLREGKAVSDVQKRIQRRKDYMEEVSQRNDSGLALILIAAFLLPSLVILGVAYGTGYLDQLYTNTLSNGMR